MTVAIDYSLYLVTDPDIAGGAQRVADIVANAVQGGVTVVQLRDKHASDEEFLQRAKALVNSHPGVPVFVNDRFDVAKQLGVHLHIGQNDMPYVEARRLLPTQQAIGLSIETGEQLEQLVAKCAAARVPLPDVIGIGPVWATATKQDHAAPLGPAGVAAIAERARAIGVRSVAIGGVHAANAELLREVPVDGICVVSAIMGATDPQAAAHTLRQRWR
ncbi:thiamine phosphate synthase [Corynebacterium choanae]|uniref:Thiamine-phosphate synthase n=1 Tax=Corynebacterium choanae TaxID=1862358 RepID=A0A3G6JAL5_9CORY|nr:thiamine phosphate synthase [Corynebacterium choanae]AZA13520.1 Thiamine-phosphate synthase [Corynebacterium choanae]